MAASIWKITFNTNNVMPAAIAFVNFFTIFSIMEFITIEVLLKQAAKYFSS